MASFKPPKPYRLEQSGVTRTQFEAWKHNILYNLQMDKNFAPFLANNIIWKKQSAGSPNRGLLSDTEGDDRKTAAQKVLALNLMLEQISSWCPYIARTFIVKQSTSLNDVWRKIREHYDFLSTGAQFLDLSLIKMDSHERAEDLYQKLFIFFEDNLVKGNDLQHNGETLDVDEEMTPTVENVITWYWLHVLHPGLPQLVKQRYGTELRNKTVGSLKTEISQSLTSLMSELQSCEESNGRVFRAGGNFRSPGTGSSYKKQYNNKSARSCTLCKAAGRQFNSHWLSQCTYLTQDDRKALARSVSDNSHEEDVLEIPQDERHRDTGNAYLDDEDDRITRRVSNIQSPVIDVGYHSSTLFITIDCGATTNLIRESVASRYGIKVLPATQNAAQADGLTNLKTVGEVHFKVTRGDKTFMFDGLVVKDLNDDILGGMPFMTKNDIGVRPARSMIVLHGDEIVKYNNKGICTPMVRRSQSFVLKGPKNKSVILPGEKLMVETPKEAVPNVNWALEPRFDSNSCEWFSPQVVEDIDHMIEITNNTDVPVVIGKHSHIGQIRSISEIPPEPCEMSQENNTTVISGIKTNQGPFSINVSVNPDGLVAPEIVSRVNELNRSYDKVFDPAIPCYNGYSGNVKGHINMGTAVPPQRKGRTPQYNHEKLTLLQEKFDQLEASGVFAKPEDVGVVAEYLNLSFLVQKPSGGQRLVTAFAEIGQYSRPQPSIMPNIDATLRTIGQWKYIIKTDLQQAYYQIPLSKETMRYCGVATPFKGVRVYTRCAMGLPGSETALEEVMNRVVGDLIMEGSAAKVADDLYCGGDTPEDAISAWSRLLQALDKNNLGLAAHKTIMFPKSTVVLGWVWKDGTLSACTHRIAALSAVAPPSTVRAMRSFIGAFKYLSRVVRQYSDIAHPLERSVAGRESQEKIEWTDELLVSFRKVQESLKDCHAIHIARPSDIVWIRTDGALKPDSSSNSGIAATLFLVRDGQVLLGGFFSAQLRKGQSLWLPCEVEALAIASAATYFSPVIVQSKHQTNVATDSKPCVEAYQRMCRGMFSNSARVMAYLSAVCRYQIKVSHIAGVNIPFTDYSSRHAAECPDNNCQVCKFIQEYADQVIRKITVQEVLSGQVKMPFVSRQAWRETQKDCADLRKLHAFLSSGTRPTKKMKKLRDVKTYLQKVVIAKDGLLVVLDSMVFQKEHERIVVPQNVIQGLLTACHLRFEHPTAHQLKCLMSRYFYAINLDKFAESVTDACDLCNGLKFMPAGICDQSSVSPPTEVGTSFALDVIKREGQLIVVLRETVTSYTVTTFSNTENHDDMRDSIVILSAEVKCVGSEIRIDPGPGLASLVNDPGLKSHGISLVLGHVKNKNKNPVAERAVEEIESEILRIQPIRGPISKVKLALATSATNSRIRRDGLSSRELWTHRDQLTGSQLSIDDKMVISNQSASRHKNHPVSAKSKAHGRPQYDLPQVSIGSLTYLKSERNKLQARPMYLICGLNTADQMCTVRKFVKGQFRAKTYQVSLADVYPVVGAKFQTRNPIIRYGSESSDSESVGDQDPVVPVVPDSSDDEAPRRYPLRATRNPFPSYADSSGSDYSLQDSDTEVPP